MLQKKISSTSRPTSARLPGDHFKSGGALKAAVEIGTMKHHPGAVRRSDDARRTAMRMKTSRVCAVCSHKFWNTFKSEYKNMQSYRDLSSLSFTRADHTLMIIYIEQCLSGHLTVQVRCLHGSRWNRTAVWSRKSRTATARSEHTVWRPDNAHLTGFRTSWQLKKLDSARSVPKFRRTPSDEQNVQMSSPNSSAAG